MRRARRQTRPCSPAFARGRRRHCPRISSGIIATGLARVHRTGPGAPHASMTSVARRSCSSLFRSSAAQRVATARDCARDLGARCVRAGAGIAAAVRRAAAAEDRARDVGRRRARRRAHRRAEGAPGAARADRRDRRHEHRRGRRRLLRVRHDGAGHGGARRELGVGDRVPERHAAQAEVVSPQARRRSVPRRPEARSQRRRVRAAERRRAGPSDRHGVVARDAARLARSTTSTSSRCRFARWPAISRRAKPSCCARATSRARCARACRFRPRSRRSKSTDACSSTAGSR